MKQSEFAGQLLHRVANGFLSLELVTDGSGHHALAVFSFVLRCLPAALFGHSLT